MAAVYAGRLRGIAGFQRLVAVKVIHSHLSGEERFIRMFLDEARLAAGIHHPNVCEVFELGEDEGLYYMVCELILGQSLGAFQRRAAEKSVVVSPVLYARICAAACLALQAAHDLTSPEGESLGLVHRDVSPRNILVTYDGFVKLIDFGVAYAQDRISHTDVGTLKGKLGYMSPEQMRGRPVDRRGDIFSLGVVLYQMVTGRQPFYGSTDIERLNKLLDFQFDRPRQLVPDLPPALENIILRSMSFSPADRYPTAHAMGSALDAFIRASSVADASEDLPFLMKSMFEEERGYHLQKLRELADKRTHSERPWVDEVTVNLRAQTTAVLRRPRAPERSTHEATGQRNAGKTKAAIIVAAICISVLLLPLSIHEMPFDVSPMTGAASNPGNKQVATAPMFPASDVAFNIAIVTAPLIVPVPEVRIGPAISPLGADLGLDASPVASGTEILRLPTDDTFRHLRLSAAGNVDKIERLQADTDKSISLSLTPIPSVKRPPPRREKSPKKSPAPIRSNNKKAAKETSKQTDTPKETTAPGLKKSSLLEQSPYR